MNPIVRYVQKQLFAQKGAIANNKAVNFSAAKMAERLSEFGFDPRLIQDEKQLVQILNLIKEVEDKAFAQKFSDILKPKKSAEVFNIEGQQLDPNKPIMGGTQTGKELSPELAKRLRGTEVDRIKQRIADKKVETDAEIKARLEKDNEKGLAKIRNQQKMLADAIDDASPGFANDIKVDAELVAENLAERMGLVYDDLPTKQRLNLYDQAYTGLSKQRFKGMRKPDDDPEEKADGGRIGFKMGRRAFLKALGTGIGGAAALKTGIIGLGTKKAVTGAGEKIITAPVKGKPEWFDDLINKVITQGDDVTKQLSTKEREIVHKLDIDNLDDVTVTQDLDEGIVRVEYNSPNNMGEDKVELVFKSGRGQMDETTGKVADEFYAVEKEPRGIRTGPDDYDIEFDGENFVRSVDDLQSDTSKLKEVATGKKQTLSEFVNSKKKKDKVKLINEDQVEQAEYLEQKYGPGPEDTDDFASGGLAGYSGGGIVRAIIKNLAKERGINPSDYLKIANYKALPPEAKRIMSEAEFNRIKQRLMEARMQVIENIRDMVKGRLDFNKSKEEFRKSMGDYGMKGMADDLIEKTLSDKQFESVVPKSVTERDFLEIEQMIKNMQTKDGRKMNASGGLAGMLGQ